MSDTEAVLKTDGGPAFPSVDPNYDKTIIQGMTLRDWFAGQALPALSSHSQSSTYIAQKAWDIADAMLAQKRMLAQRRAELE